MKISRIVLAVLFALAASANTLRAVPSLPTFSFHENGNGQLELPLLFGDGVIPLPGTLMSDPGPGGLASALTFTAHPLVNPLITLSARRRLKRQLEGNKASQPSKAADFYPVRAATLSHR
jgi:hypothetical protein